ncbi:hypothetical protein ABMY26_00580 (plasmid) [Azospirillum sp. HJ39]|uniref:hypothetical protein n=1 Tax=Azospirillum sp. HJ39 TaxID=3159496 RepID=UPI00355936F3
MDTQDLMHHFEYNNSYTGVEMRILMVVILAFGLVSCQTSKGAQTSVNTNSLNGAQDLTYDSIVYTRLSLSRLKWCRENNKYIEEYDKSIRSLRAAGFKLGMSQYEADQAELLGTMLSAEYGCVDQDTNLITQKIDAASDIFRKGGASLSSYKSQYKGIIPAKYGPALLKEKSIFCNNVDGITSFLKALSDGDRNMYDSLINKNECAILSTRMYATVKSSNDVYDIVRIYGNGVSYDGVTIGTSIIGK